MKKIGIIGGLGPEPTIEYYKIISSHFHGRPDGYPRIVIYSMDVDELASMFESERLDLAADTLMEGINAIHAAGADFGLIAANTPHLVFDRLENISPLPLLSIVKETRRAVMEAGFKRVGLLGTKYTMSSRLFQNEMDPEGIYVSVPEKEDQEYIQEKIYGELTAGRFLDTTRAGLLDIISRLKKRDSIEAVILGCTELPLILDRDELGLRFIDTARIHAEGAVRHCLDES